MYFDDLGADIRELTSILFFFFYEWNWYKVTWVWFLDDDGGGSSNDGVFSSFHAECPPRPLHLHLRAGTVSLCPRPAGDAG